MEAIINKFVEDLNEDESYKFVTRGMSDTEKFLLNGLIRRAFFNGVAEEAQLVLKRTSK